MLVPFAQPNPLLDTLLLCIAAAREDDGYASVDLGTLHMQAEEMLQRDVEAADIEAALDEITRTGRLVAHPNLDRPNQLLWTVPVVPDRARLWLSDDRDDWVEYRRGVGAVERRTPSSGWTALDDLRLALLLLYDEEACTVLRAWGIHDRLRLLNR